MLNMSIVGGLTMYYHKTQILKSKHELTKKKIITASCIPRYRQFWYLIY